MYKIKKISTSSLFKNVVDVKEKKFATVKEAMAEALKAASDFAVFLLENEYRISTIQIVGSRRVSVYDYEGMEYGTFFIESQF